MLRSALILLVVLACAKLALNAYFYERATRDVIISAYRQRALSACAHNARTRQIRMTQADWKQLHQIELTIGRSDVDVRLWQVGNARWSQRFQTPYLRVSMQSGHQQLSCHYDIVHGRAHIEVL